MAAIAQHVSQASRQPFAVLGEARLRAVESTKNHQNGLRASSLKRPRDITDLSDTENIDPASLESPAKRSKGQAGTDELRAKEKFYLVTPHANVGSSRKPCMNTPTLPHAFSTSTPRSAPLRAAAGRSPRSKIAKAFARRSIGFCRVDPPSFSKRHVSHAPFSISDALNGTFSVSSFSADKSIPGGSKNHRKAWDFEIHVDTEQEEMANLMEHSTCVLDISDDEAKTKKDERGKENIPPPDFRPQVAALEVSESAPRAETVKMLDSPRSPLGELDPKDFVPEGEDLSTSTFVQVLEDEQVDASLEHSYTTAAVLDTPAYKTGPTLEQPQLLKQAIIYSLIKGTAPVVQKNEAPDTDKESVPCAAEAKIRECSDISTETAEGDSNNSVAVLPVEPVMS
ncbi:hypothetical protein PRK78_001633 [Emydomyces testavorans]|uniref:Thymidylate kinase n=1 Tax=Emydomyces testavorans TaxID=2070801 RepID=A0AAF0DEG7_9EURO|nr:hypothetical protein PRK78_001633 [Emydomyces testavorans]